MRAKFDLDDFLTFEETGEEAEDWDESDGPVIAVKFLGVEVERAVMPQWGWEKSYIDTDKYRSKAEKLIKRLWVMEGAGT